MLKFIILQFNIEIMSLQPPSSTAFGVFCLPLYFHKCEVQVVRIYEWTTRLNFSQQATDLCYDISFEQYNAHCNFR